MKLLIGLLILSFLGYGTWWASDSSHFSIKHHAERLLNLNSVQVWKPKFLPEQLIALNEKTLIKSSKEKFFESSLKYYPYLLLEVKYSPSSSRTKEGHLLWDLSDGEMVIDTKAWKKTHGFADFIRAQITPSELKVLSALIKNGGSITAAALIKDSPITDNFLQGAIKSLQRKNLLFFTKERYQLHIENPIFPKLPETRLRQKIILNDRKATQKVAKQFSSSQVQKLAKMVFGHRFSVRSSELIYLPVYTLSVQKADGSLRSSDWNGLNGQPFSNSIH